MPLKSKAKNLDPRRLRLLIYGQPGTGKSTFLSQVPNCAVLATDPGLHSLDIDGLWYPKVAKGEPDGDPDLSYVINHWTMLSTAVQEVCALPEIEIVAIDTLDQAVALAEECVLEEIGTKEKERGVEKGKNKTDGINNGALGFGEGFRRVGRKLRNMLNFIMGSGKGCILVNHEVVEKVHNSERVFPNIPDIPRRDVTPREAVEGSIDCVLYANVRRNEAGDLEHVLYTSSGYRIIAKDRTGKLPPEIPLNYAAFLECFREA